MVVIDSLQNGIVIDHIKAGLGHRILSYLNIDRAKYTVAFIMNADSKKHGKKDLIKIENVDDVDLTALGLIDPTATVNFIENQEITRKIKLELPEKVVDVIKCNNPRCVTSVELHAPHIFHLIDGENREYRCEYCDHIVSMKGDFENEIMRRQWIHYQPGK